MRRVLACTASAATVLAAAPAHAGDGDGAYGRLDGDLIAVFGAGTGLASAGSRHFVSAESRLRYLDAAGIVVAYEEAGLLREAQAPGDLRRAFVAAIEIRPLFPSRFFKNWESGTRFLDLVVDSIGIEVGTWWAARVGDATARPGLLAGLGIEVPLTGYADGLWLRIAANARWSAARLEREDDPGGRQLFLQIGLAWHAVLAPGLVQPSDGPLR